MERKICARGTQENFNTHGNFVRVEKSSTDLTPKSKPTPQPPAKKEPQETVRLKYGKILVTVKNTENLAVTENDNSMIIRFEKVNK